MQAFRLSPYSDQNQETSSPFIEAPVYRMKGGLLGTTMPRSSFLKASGKKFDVGKEYEISGRVEGISRFETSHIEREESKLRRQISLIVGKDEGRLVSGQRCKIAIDSVTERKHFRVSSGERRIIEMWYPAMNSVGFPKAGRFSKDSIVEFQAASKSEPGEAPKRCFVIVRPTQQTMEMRVRRLGFRPKDIVKITGSRSYNIRDFVKDFNTHQRVGLENTLLKLRQGVLTMLVDDRRIELRNPRLNTVALQVILSAEIGNSKRLTRFLFDGERTNPRIDLFRIYKVEASQLGLRISYMKDKSRVRSFHHSFEEFGPKHLCGIRLISPPEAENDSFHYRVSAKFQADVTSRLAESSDNRRLVKGTISEKIQRHILSSMPDWFEVEEHPFDKVRKTDDSRQNGPDGLWRLKTTGEFNYLEFKWRQGSKDSYYQGQDEVRRYLAKYPAYQGKRVSGGYVGLIEWNIKSRDLFFYLKKVELTRTHSKLKRYLAGASD
jgi:hypothetical protein